MVKKRLRPGTDVGYVSDEATRVSECPIYDSSFPPSRPRNRNRKSRLFGLGGGVYGRRSVGGALQGDRTVDSALTLNCVERNDRGMPVMWSSSNATRLRAVDSSTPVSKPSPSPGSAAWRLAEAGLRRRTKAA